MDLSCPICLCNFNKNKKPYTLTCGHNFCSSCLNIWSQNCSICREPILILPTGPNNLILEIWNRPAKIGVVLICDTDHAESVSQIRKKCPRLLLKPIFDFDPKTITPIIKDVSKRCDKLVLHIIYDKDSMMIFTFKTKLDLSY